MQLVQLSTINNTVHSKKTPISEISETQLVRIHLNISGSGVFEATLASEKALKESDITLIKSLIELTGQKLPGHTFSSNDLNVYFEAISDSNPLNIAIDREGKIIHYGSAWSKIPNSIELHSHFCENFNFEGDGDSLDHSLTEISEKNRIFFFSSSNGVCRYKATVIRKYDHFILLTQPIINAQYKLSSYGLDLKDFLPHEYIAEFIFLQGSTQKALEESRILNEKLKQRNKEVESLSSFPSENPNPILRFSIDGKVLYLNPPAKECFKDVLDGSETQLSKIVNEIVLSELDRLNGRIVKDGKEFLYAARYFKTNGYVNLYLFEITMFIEEIESLNLSLAKQRDFYEQILNGIPNDIAVFDENHKYIFVNPQGIRNDEIRNFMIGKDDFDYCKLKGISDDLAHERRAVFNKIIETGTTVEWEDHHKDKDGNSIYVLRKMTPLFDIHKNVRMVIGYGVDITKRIEVEKKLLKAHEENTLLRNFIDKTNDAIQVVDETGKLIYLNEEAIKRLGFTSLNYKDYFVGDFEPMFSDLSKWKEHFYDLKERKSLNMQSKNTNIESGKITDVDLNLNWEEINGEGYVIAVSRDITEKKRAEIELEQKRKFQEILIETAKRYINIAGSDIEKVINESLSFIGEFTAVDRVYIFDYDHRNGTSSNTFEWCANGIEPEISNLQNIPFDYIPDWTNAHFNGDEMYISDVTQLEQGILRNILEPQGIKSLLAIPMFKENQCIGFVGFDSVNDLKEFSNDERHLLRLFAEMLVNIFERANYLKEIEQSRKTISDHNERLEIIVQEEIKKNLELSNLLTNQDKLATIGEVAAGIAHDLNTPLGSVKIGLESVDYIISRIFDHYALHLSLEEILVLYEKSKMRKLDIFQNSSKTRSETKSFGEVLISRYNLNEEDAKQLARLFVQCQINTSEDKIIKQILGLSNPKSGLEIFYSFMSFFNLINSSKISVHRASEVVQNMRAFIKNTPNSNLQRINIDHSLKTVLSVFNHHIRKKVTLEYNIDDNIEIEGYEVKLFQLWSNLIKNAIEAMESQPNSKLLIYATNTTEKIHVHISNNGAMIPEDIKDQIFNKFFSTKHHKSGTGIGLSIVSSIVAEHHAHMHFESNPEQTTFTVTFNKLN